MKEKFAMLRSKDYPKVRHDVAQIAIRKCQCTMLRANVISPTMKAAAQINMATT